MIGSGIEPTDIGLVNCKPMNFQIRQQPKTVTFAEIPISKTLRLNKFGTTRI